MGNPSSAFFIVMAMISFLSKQAHQEIGSLSHGRHLNLRKVATLRRENRWLLPFAGGSKHHCIFTLRSCRRAARN
jgi:hypothetical protein